MYYITALNIDFSKNSIKFNYANFPLDLFLKKKYIQISLEKESINQKEEKSKTYNKKAIVAFILSWLGFVLIFLMPVAFILGIIAYREIKKTKEKGRALSIWSIFFGGVMVFGVLSTLILAFLSPR